MPPTHPPALARAAALGLVLGATSACASRGGTPATPEEEPQTVVVPPVQAANDEPAPEPVVLATPRQEDAPIQSDCEPAGAGGACAGVSCKARVNCKGLNECKGLGGCKTATNECKGKNDCKGKGGCAAHCPR